MWPARMAAAGISPRRAWRQGPSRSRARCHPPPAGFRGDGVAGWHWALGLHLASVGGGRFLDVPLSAAAPVTVSSSKASGAWSVLVVAGGPGVSLTGSGAWRCVVAVLVPVKWSWPLSGTTTPVAGGAAFSGSAVELPLGVGSAWPTRAVAFLVVGAACVSVGRPR
jgi:hypothetical protein